MIGYVLRLKDMGVGLSCSLASESTIDAREYIPLSVFYTRVQNT